MAKISMPAIRTKVFGQEKIPLTTPAGMAQRATYQTRNLDYKSRAPFAADFRPSNISPKKVTL